MPFKKCQQKLYSHTEYGLRYSYDTVPKVYLPDCVSLPRELIDSLYLLTVLLPSRAVGKVAFENTAQTTDLLCRKNGFCRLTCLDSRETVYTNSATCASRSYYDSNIEIQRKVTKAVHYFYHKI